MKKLPNIIAHRDLAPMTESPDLIHVPWLYPGFDDVVFALGWLWVNIYRLDAIEPEDLLAHGLPCKVDF